MMPPFLGRAKLVNDVFLQVPLLVLMEIRENFSNDRMTKIIDNKIDLTLEDLIAQEERVVTLSHGGYIKAQSLSDYQAQRRGGKGKAATKMKDEDFVDQLFVANSHDTVLCRILQNI
jgi:DNA gyrase subunit A